MRDFGVIFYCKISVFYMFMLGEMINNIVGYVLNLKNRLFFVGGSFGGEGVFFGLCGSFFGVGIDIGGSVRFLFVFNGFYGLRFFSGRFFYEGMVNSMDG